MDMKEFYNQNKKLLWICGSVILIVIIVATILILTSNKPKDNINANQFSYLPSNTCPDQNNIFTENGQSRADLNGKPYLIRSEDVTWINQNCKASSLPQETQMPSPTQTAVPTEVVESSPPLMLKSIGFNLENYNSATNMAGDMKFTKMPLHFDQIFSPFGQQDPRTTDTTKKNPQPVYILPLGTNVLSLVDGEVIDVKQIYSGDYTVMVAKDKNSRWIYETEHINNPTVQIGAKVTAGQVLGKVSDYDSKNHPGFGVVEIGILHAAISGVPEHVCPFAYMDPSIKDSTNAKISNLYSAWEKYLGKDIYKQETFLSPGCVTENPAAG
jgi:hypothetical protein